MEITKLYCDSCEEEIRESYDVFITGKEYEYCKKCLRSLVATSLTAKGYEIMSISIWETKNVEP